MAAGVFLGATPGTAPAAYSGSLSASSIAPKLGQVFPIGDGLTGNGTGTRQEFQVPNGAVRLYFVDIDGFKWSDNGGKFTIVASSQQAQIDINETSDKSDNVTVFNPASTGEGVAQAIPAKITNTTSTTQTFQLSVSPAASATLNVTTVTLPAGDSTKPGEIMIKPKADSLCRQ